jgi:hypothetical protein
LVPLGFGGFRGEHLTDADGVEQVEVVRFEAEALALVGLVHPVAREAGEVVHGAIHGCGARL